MHQRWRGNEGLSLIEMMVALLVLGVAVAGLTATLTNSLNLTRQNHNRVIAANLASGAIEDVLTREFGEEQLGDGEDPSCDDDDATLLELVGECTRDTDVDGRPFTITRHVYWSANDAALGPCAPDDADAADENILRIDVRVTWPRPGNIPPVTSATSVAPPVDLFDTEGGIIAVHVQDEEAEPLSDAQVALIGPEEGTASTLSGITNENGCAVFSGLGIGTYHAVLHKNSPHDDFPGYLDPNQRVTTTWPPSGSLPPPSDDVTGMQSVSARSRSTIDFFYSAGTALTVVPEGWDGGDVPSFFIGGATWLYANDRAGSPYEGPHFGGTHVVYPGVYELYTEYCDPTSDPAHIDPNGDGVEQRWPGATRDTVNATGDETDGVVTFGTFTVDWDVVIDWDLVDDPDDPPTPPDVTVRAEYPIGQECPSDDVFDLAETTAGDEQLRFAMPWGAIDVWAEDDDGDIVSSIERVTVRPTDIDADEVPGVELTVLLP